jgi:hypothetical protein
MGACGRGRRAFGTGLIWERRNVSFVHALMIIYILSASSGWTLDEEGSTHPNQLAREIVMADMSELGDWREAEGFLSQNLPLATAGNPKYRQGGDVELTEWLIKSVRFAPSTTPPGIQIALSEEALVFRDGAQTAVNSHEAEFAIEDVHIIEYDYPADTTEKGEKAVGIMFKCRSGKCINSRWNGHPSAKEAVDLYLYDAALRERILRAFAIVEKAARGEM